MKRSMKSEVVILVASAVVVVAGGIGLLLRAGGGPAERGSAAVAVEQAAATYDPVDAGEVLPEGYRIGLERDAIEPVYVPTFTAASDVDWPADALVIGIVGEADAKAYPVTHLNSREMVVDSLEGDPILVSW